MANFKEIKDLIDLMRDTDVVEIEVERGGGRIRVRRETGIASRPPAEGVPRLAPATLAVTAGPGPLPAPEQERAAPPSNIVTVTAPLVGRFYRAPAPDAAAYVEVGDRVRKGQVICIIEAMKLMNEIESEHNGVVRAVLAETGRSVEFGAPLFEIERSE